MWLRQVIHFRFGSTVKTCSRIVRSLQLKMLTSKAVVGYCLRWSCLLLVLGQSQSSVVSSVGRGRRLTLTNSSCYFLSPTHLPIPRQESQPPQVPLPGSKTASSCSSSVVPSAAAHFRHIQGIQVHCIGCFRPSDIRHWYAMPSLVLPPVYRLKISRRRNICPRLNVPGTSPLDSYMSQSYHGRLRPLVCRRLQSTSVRHQYAT